MSLDDLRKEKDELVKRVRELDKRIKSLEESEEVERSDLKERIKRGRREAVHVKKRIEEKGVEKKRTAPTQEALSDFIIDEALSEEVELRDEEESEDDDRKELTPKEEVMKLLFKNNKVSFSKLSKVLNLSEDEVNELALELEEEGEVVITNPLIGAPYLKMK